MKAIQIETFGSPAEVVKAVDVPDVGAPAAGGCRPSWVRKEWAASSRRARASSR